MTLRPPSWSRDIAACIVVTSFAIAACSAIVGLFARACTGAR